MFVANYIFFTIFGFVISLHLKTSLECKIKLPRLRPCLEEDRLWIRSITCTWQIQFSRKRIFKRTNFILYFRLIFPRRIISYQLFASIRSIIIQYIIRCLVLCYFETKEIRNFIWIPWRSNIRPLVYIMCIILLKG